MDSGNEAVGARGSPHGEHSAAGRYKRAQSRMLVLEHANTTELQLDPEPIHILMSTAEFHTPVVTRQDNRAISKDNDQTKPPTKQHSIV